MKPDVLTLAIAIFVIGVLASGLGITDVFHAEPTPAVAEFQAGLHVDASPIKEPR